MSMLLLKYHKVTPEHVDESQVDQQSERMTVDITDAAGNTTEQERAVYFSVRTYHRIVNLMAHPYAAVQERDAPLEKEPLHVAHVCSLAFVPFRHGARV